MQNISYLQKFSTISLNLILKYLIVPKIKKNIFNSVLQIEMIEQ